MGEITKQANITENIATSFEPIEVLVKTLEAKYEILMEKIIKDWITEETSAIARELRLKYVKVGTSGEDIRKELKSGLLEVGRDIDKKAKTFSEKVKERKDELMGIEKHLENLEKERIQKLASERSDVLFELDIPVAGLNLGEMTDDVWENYLVGAKSNKKAEKKAEKERKRKEKENDVFMKRLIILAEFKQFCKDWKPPITKKTTMAEYKTILAELKVKKTEFKKEQEKIKKENEKLKGKAEKEKEKQKTLTNIREFSKNEIEKIKDYFKTKEKR